MAVHGLIYRRITSASVTERVQLNLSSQPQPMLPPSVCKPNHTQLCPASPCPASADCTDQLDLCIGFAEQVPAEEACQMCRHEWMRQAMQCWLKRQACQGNGPTANGGPVISSGTALS